MSSEDKIENILKDSNKSLQDFVKIQQNHRIINLFEKADIPPEYMSYSLKGEKTYSFVNKDGKIIPSKVEAYNSTLQYIKNLKHYKDKGVGVFLWGMPNQRLGMSLLGTFILRAALEYGYSGMYISFPTFCEDMNCNFDFENKDRYYEIDFLLIDSISIKSQKTSKIIDGFSDVILYRRKEKKPTIFSSYISPDQLALLYSESLQSYLDEFIIKLHIRNEGGEGEVNYNIDLFINFLQEKRKLQKFYTKNELESILKEFQMKYDTLRIK